MAKISISKLKLNKETARVNIKIGEVDVEVKQYVPIVDKLFALDVIIQEAFDYNFINKAKADALLHMFIVQLYTNISLTKKEKEEILDTYDLMEKNGVIDTIVSAIPENEYNAFVNYFNEVIGDYDKYKNSVVGVAEQILGQLPDKLESINKNMGQFKPEDLKVLTEAIKGFGGNESALVNTVIGQN